MATTLPPMQGLWIGSHLSLMEQLSIRSFLANGHPFHLYTYGGVRNAPVGTTLCDAAAILPKEQVFRQQQGYKHRGSYSTFSNLFRFKLLAEKGGYWSDLDIVCLKPLDLQVPYLFASERTGMNMSLTQLCTCFMAMPQGSAIATEAYEQASALDPATLRWTQNGRGVLWPLIQKHNLQRYMLPPEKICPFNTWPMDAFITPGPFLETLKTAYTVHLWHDIWRYQMRLRKRVARFLRGRPYLNKNLRYPATTLYGYLQQQFL